MVKPILRAHLTCVVGLPLYIHCFHIWILCGSDLLGCTKKENASGTHLQLKARNQTLSLRSMMPTRSMKSRSTGSGHSSLASARGKPRFGSETCLSARQSASEEENTLDAWCFLRKRWQFFHKRIWPVYYPYIGTSCSNIWSWLMTLQHTASLACHLKGPEAWH